MNSVEKGGNGRKIGGLTYPVPAERRCTARNRAGQQCGSWAMRGKTKCRLHGGKSTGPKTASGKKRLAAARTITGKHSLDSLKSRMLERLRPAWDLYFDDPIIRRRITPAEFAALRARAFVDYLQPWLMAMGWAEFRAKRKHLVAFCRGEIAFLEFAKRLEGKA